MLSESEGVVKESKTFSLFDRRPKRKRSPKCLPLQCPIRGGRDRLQPNSTRSNFWKQQTFLKNIFLGGRFGTRVRRNHLVFLFLAENWPRPSFRCLHKQEFWTAANWEFPVASLLIAKEAIAIKVLRPFFLFFFSLFLLAMASPVVAMASST